MGQVLKTKTNDGDAVSGEFMDIGGERYYAIRNVDKMEPFFISIVSDTDHWLFISSTGGLTAGRVSPETALFPYVTVDKIHESTTHTGSKTILRVKTAQQQRYWEPFNREQDGRYAFSRNLYKNRLGNKLCFEEINHDLELAFRYTWRSSDSYGFSRQCELQNLGSKDAAYRSCRRPAEYTAGRHAAFCPDKHEQPGRRLQVDRTATKKPGWHCSRCIPALPIAPSPANRCERIPFSASALQDRKS